MMTHQCPGKPKQQEFAEQQHPADLVHRRSDPVGQRQMTPVARSAGTMHIAHMGRPASWMIHNQGSERRQQQHIHLVAGSVVAPVAAAFAAVVDTADIATAEDFVASAMDAGPAAPVGYQPCSIGMAVGIEQIAPATVVVSMADSGTGPPEAASVPVGVDCHSCTAGMGNAPDHNRK